MRVIEVEEVRQIHNKLGHVSSVDTISTPTSSCTPLAAHKYGDGCVVELVKYTYSQGLWKHLHLLYERIEVV